MIVYDVATKVLDTKISPQGNIAGLISGITGEAFMVKGNKHNTHVHTHTHTHTHIHADSKSSKSLT